MMKRIRHAIFILVLVFSSMSVLSGVTDTQGSTAPTDNTQQSPATQPENTGSETNPGTSTETPSGTTPATNAQVIDSTYSGLWLDPARDGEGFSLVVSETTAGPTVVVSYYTYDNQKQTIFLIGAQSLPSGATSITIPVTITSGAKFGDAFKPADVVRTPAGTLTFSFTSCDTGIVDYNLNALGSGSRSIVRLLGVEDLDCR